MSHADGTDISSDKMYQSKLPLKEYWVYSGNYCSLRTYRPVERSVHVAGHVGTARAVCATRCARAGTGAVCVGVGCTGGGQEWGCGGVEPDSRALL